MNYNIAYFSAEIGISSSLPTYSGGLGVLSGDHIKASADLGINMCAITLLYKEGYYKQHLDELGIQSETYPKFDPFPILSKLDINFKIHLRDRDVNIIVYRLNYKGITGHIIPIFFLDTDIKENFHDDRIITLRLYSGDKDHRILQEAILGFGGIKLLQTLSINSIKTYHMNEGHCSFLTLALLKKYHNQEKIKKLCHFTTHTPVPSGHDHFSIIRCKKLLRGLMPEKLELPSMISDNRLHMTELGLYYSRSANAVSKLHRKVAKDQFHLDNIDYITNGVHHSYWISTPLKNLLDKYFKNWEMEPTQLINIDKIPDNELYEVHQHVKNRLLAYANSQTFKALDRETLTIGFARRAAAYKRINLIFHDLNKFLDIGNHKIQIIFAGKAHPNDEYGKSLIKSVFKNAKKLRGKIKVIYLDNYNMWLGKLITSGVDIWLNTPLRPNEASGTSGMKAAFNGVPNLSILDGWWAEGCEDGINGWSIGDSNNSDDLNDANKLYEILQNKVIPMFYEDKKSWVKMMKASIKTGVNYSAIRMVNQYNEKFYKK